MWRRICHDGENPGLPADLTQSVCPTCEAAIVLEDIGRRKPALFSLSDQHNQRIIIGRNGTYATAKYRNLILSPEAEVLMHFPRHRHTSGVRKSLGFVDDIPLMSFIVTKKRADDHKATTIDASGDLMHPKRQTASHFPIACLPGKAEVRD